MNRARKGICRIGIGGIAFFVIIMVLLASLCGWLWYNREAGKPTAAFGREWMSMRSGDMEPAVAKGSLLLLRTVESEVPAVGETVVTGREDGRGGVVYRVLEEDSGRLLLKADRADSAVEMDSASVTHVVTGVIPYLGAVWDFLLTAKGVILVLAVPSALFLILELIGLLRYAKAGNPLLEQQGDLRGKLSGFTEEDQKENFVDVTAEYTGVRSGRKYRSPLRQETEIEEEKPEKFADLDFNPLAEKRQPDRPEMETVEIPAQPGKLMKILIDGKEAASVPLENSCTFSVKTEGCRIDITVVPGSRSPE